MNHVSRMNVLTSVASTTSGSDFLMTRSAVCVTEGKPPTE
jgi:hypothetical protein